MQSTTGDWHFRPIRTTQEPSTAWPRSSAKKATRTPILHGPLSGSAKAATAHRPNSNAWQFRAGSGKCAQLDAGDSRYSAGTEALRKLPAGRNAPQEPGVDLFPER